MTEKVPLNTEELRFAKLRLDEARVQELVLKAQLEIAKKEVELGLPNRKASEHIDNIEENIKRNDMNITFYEKQIREGKEVTNSNAERVAKESSDVEDGFREVEDVEEVEVVE